MKTEQKASELIVDRMYVIRIQTVAHFCRVEKNWDENGPICPTPMLTLWKLANDTFNRPIVHFANGENCAALVVGGGDGICTGRHCSI